MAHPWHDVPVPETKDAIVPVVVETSAGSRAQYEVDLASGLLRCKRILPTAAHYPANYGFIPRTMAEDRTGVDALVLGNEGLAPCSILRARVIGVLQVVDAGRQDPKIIAVHADDPAFAEYRSLDALPLHWRRVIERFFRDYRALESAERGMQVGPFDGPEAALRVVHEGLEKYRTSLRGRSTTPASVPAR